MLLGSWTLRLVLPAPLVIAILEGVLVLIERFPFELKVALATDPLPLMIELSRMLKAASTDAICVWYDKGIFVI